MAKICKRGHISSTLQGGRHKCGNCKECTNERNRTSEFKKIQKAYEATPERRAQLKARYAADPRRRIFICTKSRAKRLGVRFEISIDDIVVPSHCPWLGIPLHTGREKVCGNSPSIDKIIPELGYVRGNIIVISHRANQIKSNATIEELTRVLAGLRSVYPKWLG